MTRWIRTPLEELPDKTRRTIRRVMSAGMRSARFEENGVLYRVREGKRGIIVHRQKPGFYARIRSAGLFTQMLAMAAMIVAGLIVIYTFASGYIAYHSLAGGMALHLNAEKHIVTERGSAIQIPYEIGVTTLPLCTAHCSWEIMRHDTGEIIERRSEAFASPLNNEYHAEFTVAQRSTFPVQIVLTCANIVTELCRDDQIHKSVATTIVNATYEQNNQRGLASASATLSLINTEYSWMRDALITITSSSDTRIRDLIDPANEQISMIDQHIEQARIAIERDEPARLASMSLVLNDTISIYEERSLTQARIIASLRDIIPLAEAYANRSHLSEEQPLEVLSRLDTSRLDIIDTVADLNASLRRLLNQTQDAYDHQEQALLAAYESDRTMLCTLKGYCELELCEYAHAPERVFARADAQLLLTLDIDQAAIDEIRADTTYDALREQTIVHAREGTPITNDTLRAAIEPIASPGIRDTPLCARYVPPHIPQPTLLPLERTQQTYSFAFPPQTCCTQGSCVTCTSSPPFPVIFIHGHSFSEASAPEYNLQVFTDLLLALQEDGMYYSGHIFPQEPFPLRKGIYRAIPGPVLYTSTYYYNSYPEEGGVAFVVRKSEKIETYALRLRESIDHIRALTGSDKVVIVAHSMGGLVARSYLGLFGEDHVAALLMVATPNYGITDTTQRLCPIFGGDQECKDMEAGSPFLTQLNSRTSPTIPVLIIAGTGCYARAFDGIVDLERVLLDDTDHVIIQGNCPSTDRLLHGDLLRPSIVPESYEVIKGFIETHTR